MNRREERLERIRRVEREYQIAAIAIGGLGRQFRADPSALAGDELRHRDFLACRDNVEATYLIRLFAEFEAGLRQMWRTLVRPTSPPAQILLDSVAARFFIPATWLAQVHEVRLYRNSLVHEADEEIEKISLVDARSHVCRYFSRLPTTW
jgi:hypothetical protein